MPYLIFSSSYSKFYWNNLLVDGVEILRERIEQEQEWSRTVSGETSPDTVCLGRNSL